MKKYVIIVAGGKGVRMGQEVPKQFLPMCGIPLLMHTISAFYHFDNTIGIILVLPVGQQDYWKELCEKFQFNIVHQVATGGETRFYSVKNGLALVPEGVLVGIHDGVRPLVPVNVISNCYEKAEEEGAAFPVVPVVDTLRKKISIGSVVVDRSNYFLVQTPQVFRSDIILEAYKQPYKESFTDDVSVVEALGKYVIAEVEGSRENIKITTPVDLMIAEALMS